MITEEIEVQLPGGLHILNANRLKSLIDSTESAVFIRKENKMANCRDPISVLTLHIQYKDKVSLFCDGIDEKTVIEKLLDFFNNLD